jgi:hypothetical protein
MYNFKVTICKTVRISFREFKVLENNFRLQFVTVTTNTKFRNTTINCTFC